MKRIITWVNKKERRRLEKLNEQHGLNFIFVDNLESFIEGIQDDTISLFSRRKAYRYYKNLIQLLSEHPARLFHYFYPNDCYVPQLRAHQLGQEGNIVPLDEAQVFKLLSFKSL
jgi:hypothetical protein